MLGPARREDRDPIPRLEESQPETECRRCGEIEVCTGPGLCESCIHHFRTHMPEARL